MSQYHLLTFSSDSSLKWILFWAEITYLISLVKLALPGGRCIATMYLLPRSRCFSLIWCMWSDVMNPTVTNLIYFSMFNVVLLFMFVTQRCADFLSTLFFRISKPWVIYGDCMQSFCMDSLLPCYILLILSFIELVEFWSDQKKKAFFCVLSG